MHVSRVSYDIKAAAIFFIGAANSSVVNSVSEAIRKSDRISLTKNFALTKKKNIETTIVASKFDDNGQSQVTNCTRIWPEYGYFKQQPCDFHMDKDNFPENSILYINQGHLSVKDNKRMFYADCYLLGQVIEAINSLERSSFIALVLNHKRDNF